MVGGTVGQVVRSNHPGFAAGEFVLGYWGWQEYGLSERQRGPQARPGAGAALVRTRGAGHARHDGLRRPARHRPPAAGRDRGRLGGRGRGGLGRGSDRQDQGLPRRRYRRQRCEVPLRRRRAGLRRLRQLQDPGPQAGAQGCLPRRDRRLLRQRGRAGAGGRPAADQPGRPDPAGGADRALQRHRAARPAPT